MAYSFVWQSFIFFVIDYNNIKMSQYVCIRMELKPIFNADEDDFVSPTGSAAPKICAHNIPWALPLPQATS